MSQTHSRKPARLLACALASAAVLFALAAPAQALSAAGSTGTPAASATNAAPRTTVTSSQLSKPVQPAPSPAAPTRAASHSGGKLSTAAIVLAAVAALLAIGAAAWAVARVAAYEPRWTVSARHALAEAAFRASSTWAEFNDWVRLGR